MEKERRVKPEPQLSRYNGLLVDITVPNINIPNRYRGTCVSPPSCVCSVKRFSVRLKQPWQRLYSVGGPRSGGAEIKAEEEREVWGAGPEMTVKFPSCLNYPSASGSDWQPTIHAVCQDWGVELSSISMNPLGRLIYLFFSHLMCVRLCVCFCLFKKKFISDGKTQSLRHVYEITVGIKYAFPVSEWQKKSLIRPQSNP